MERSFLGQEEVVSSEAGQTEAWGGSLGRWGGARLTMRAIQEPTCMVRCFYLKCSLSNMSVAKRIRG